MITGGSGATSGNPPAAGAGEGGQAPPAGGSGQQAPPAGGQAPGTEGARIHSIDDLAARQAATEGALAELRDGMRRLLEGATAPATTAATAPAGPSVAEQVAEGVRQIRAQDADASRQQAATDATADLQRRVAALEQPPRQHRGPVGRWAQRVIYGIKE